MKGFGSSTHHEQLCPCIKSSSLGASAGDEYAETRGGNNNWYGHDTAMTRFNWAKLDAQRDSFFRFYRCPNGSQGHFPLYD